MKVGMGEGREKIKRNAREIVKLVEENPGLYDSLTPLQKAVVDICTSVSHAEGLNKKPKPIKA